MRPLLAASLAAAALQLGCVTANRIVMDASEYGLYRRARAAPVLEDRLTASYEYLILYPSGQYAPEVRAFFTETEAVYFGEAKSSIGGMEAYLRALPHGPNAKEAALRLRDLRALARAESTDLSGTAETTGAAVAYETERRKAVRDRIEQWLGLFLDRGVFSTPLVESKAALIVPWSLALPWPVCERAGAEPEGPKGPSGSARRCTKLLQLDYRATEEGQPEERQALVEIAIWQDEPGRPLEVVIGGPELFLRLDETVTARSAVATDPEARLRGAERAVLLAEKAFRTHVSEDASCRKTADSDVLRLACKGVELRVLAGALDGEDDRFVLRVVP